MSIAPPTTVSLIERLARGDKVAAEQLVPLMYAELRALAGHYLRGERPDHTLQPTALVGELFLKLAGSAPIEWRGVVSFKALAARQMRHLLIDHARKVNGGRTPPRAMRVPLEGVDRVDEPQGEPIDLLALEGALTALEARDPRQARIVELHYFGGLTFAEISAEVGLKERQVYNLWNAARAWLNVRMSEG